ncbi:cyclin-like protein [Laetiporus sulphureus 93-53]|uniref:Cyclin-like protein n=1 Tax=Laetiporus sulphureus 93-53 TaxID=1314785 RepID=A0A165H972_9APHY|nr:cyclin-like protein [Laetiporus sulphureus 93-53]KZT11417.1 cyclin-like protein [Laetiporus sulphureus 93-53]
MSTSLYPLASLAQIEKTPSHEDGIPDELEQDLRAYGCKLIQEAGILLKQKQVAMAAAQILFQRFWYVSSMKHFGIGDIGMGALYLASKLEECPLRMRDLINVYDLLLQRAAHTRSQILESTSSTSSTSHIRSEFKYTPMSYFGNAFHDLKDALVIAEMQILKRLGFNVNVVLPYGTLVNYLRLLGLTSREDVCTRAWGYLNDAMQTPVYALYSVPTIVSAAILLTTRHLGIPLPSSPSNRWWELFDAEWEDVWSVCGYIMRLYRERSVEERTRVMGMITKKGVRQWLDENQPPQQLE